MAHTILGVDLGTYAVKLAYLSAGLRRTQLLGLYERELGEGDDSREGLLERQLRVVQELVSLHGLKPEVVAVGVDDDVSMRVISMPLSDPKKVMLILPSMLEETLLSEVDDQVIDYTVARSGLTVEGGQAGQGQQLLVAAAPRLLVQALIDKMKAADLEPRTVTANALAPATLRVQDLAPQEAAPVAMLNLGHRLTQLCVATPLGVYFGRTIGRGGRALTAAVARAQRCTPEEAEALKRQQGVSAPGLHDALRPLLREIRQTLASYTTAYGEPVQRVLISGGSSQLPGIEGLLATELELPVAPLGVTTASWLPIELAGLLERNIATGATALGLALNAAGLGAQVNFRRGDLAYRTDYSFLRERAPHLIAAGLAVALAAGLTTLSSMRQLQQETETLERRLSAETKALFGEARTDGAAVSAELNAMINSAKATGPGIPHTSAFDLLEDISKGAPQGVLDITELQIRPKKTDIKGTAGSAQYVEDLAASLSKIACFKDIDKGKLVSVRNTGADGKPVELKQFTLSISTTCP